MIIILIGYMASGKTSIGKKLAKKLNYNFLDLDDFIEEKENMSVSEIFKTKGEIYFRKQEAHYLKALLESENNTILSVGGGTPCYSGNMDVILKSEHAKCIYLKATLPTLANKLLLKKAKRPLISHIETIEEMTEFIGKHLFERSQYYSRAEIKVSIDNKTKDDVVEDIVLQLF
ncbi:shikimate kinase [Algibacter amylolyticus]|uniref:Shikimate kinase n=1 Tax=Algibacter amylolyticus TaxID=1608400 RepID=A0A5M7B814_9FLAO|nr:shikimate kinase [Algibacter amylolyticus]KAA5824397.1 shikimate kinase [Algibacter amylolyticus]MBB5269545.1 shikimate kinase [Algibacter amylolyticus]TSJ75170.1 shikimate kinase [Algibacter amylolyticus]